ncbi:unnamed protein product [Schistocephalus solidus]|uniref:Activating signal cointegrator 1 complex subunit 2 homolog n=1 Tax=Schistocephalus solidus TaxID=70667 RepID=A0A183TUP9_SCHSO|nr:unnamed protein product [Schistocephalus solidus]
MGCQRLLCKTEIEMQLQLYFVLVTALVLGTWMEVGADGDDSGSVGYGQRKQNYKPQYQPQYKPQYQPQYKPQYQPQYKPQYQPQYKPQYQPQYKPQYQPQYKPQYQPQRDHKELGKPQNDDSKDN